MHAHVLVPLLESAVFADIMQVVSSDDDGVLHLHLTNSSGEDTTAYSYVAGEGTFFVNVGSLNGLCRENMRLLYGKASG